MKPDRFPCAIYRFLGVMLLLLTFQSNPQAAEYQTLLSIQQAAEGFVSRQYASEDARTKVKANTLDSRLRLTRCHTGLETFAPPGRKSNARKTVGVRCSAPKPWSLYVTVTLQQMKPVVVTSSNLPKNHQLQRSDLELQERNIAGVGENYYLSPERLLGKRLRHNLQPGVILTPKLIRVDKVIKRGDGLLIIARSNAIQIHTKGEALESGAIGDQIKVENSSSGKRLTALIIAPGVVEVSF